MRLTSFLFLALVTSLTASAQQSLLKSHARKQTSLWININDSTVYTHSNGRSSTILPRTQPGQPYLPGNAGFTYDTARLYNIEINQANLDGRSTHQFNTAGLPEVWTEETQLFYGPAMKTTTTYSYNAAMLPDTITTALTNSQFSDSRETYAYQGNTLVEKRTQGGNQQQSAWGSPTIDSFIATGGTGTDSFFITYYPSGSSFTEAHRHKYIRNAANNVLIDSLFHNGNFSTVTHYAYDALGRTIMDSSAMWMPAQSAMRYTVKHLYNYDANGNLTSTMIMSWHPTGPYHSSVKRDSFSYNSFNQITKQQTYDSAGTVLYGGTLSQFYYYYDPVDVQEVATGNVLQLYPIPATSYINIGMQFTRPQAFSVRIFDMQGRLVSNWQEPAQKNYNKQIPLTGMAPGQYTLHIWAGEESCSKQFMLVR